MTSSNNSTAIFSATTSVGVHVMFIALAGNFFLSQNRPIPIPKQTIKLEVIKKIPPPESDSLKEIKRQRIESFEPIKHAGLPEIEKPLEILEKTNLRQKTPVLEQKTPNPVQSPAVEKKQVIAKTLVSTRPVRKDSIVPRKAPLVQVPNSLPSSKIAESQSQATRMTIPTPKKKVLQPVNQSVSARKSVASLDSKATRVPHKNLNPKSVQTHTAPKITSSSEGQLINGRAQRVNTALLQNKAILPGAVDKKGATSTGKSLKETSSFRVPLSNISPRKLEEGKTEDKKGTSKTGKTSSNTERSASLGIEPRSVPDISTIDPRVVQGYSSEIQKKISSKIKYPKRARRKGKQGQVTVRFKVLKSGEIQDLIVVAGTPYKELNRAGLKAVRQAAPFPRLPEGIGRDFLLLELPIKFELN